MRLNLSTVKAEDIFPVLGVFGSVCVSVKGALTIGWEISLPRMYHQDESEYDDIIEAFSSACRILPAWSIIHKQDLFFFDYYHAPAAESNTYLQRHYHRHFEGRRYLRQRSYIFLSIGTKAMIDKEGKYSGLFGIDGTVTPPSESDLDIFRSKAGEFIQILTSNGLISARLLDTETDWLGGDGDCGVIQRYMMLGNESPVMSDISMGPDFVSAYDKRVQAYVLGESSHMPAVMSSVKKVDTLSTTASQIMLSTGSNLGVQLDCEHAINHYVVIPPQQETHQKLERKKRDMTAGYSSTDNRLNSEDIAEYLDDVHRYGSMTVFAHLNILAWGPESERHAISGKVTAAITAMGATATFNRHNTPVLYYAGIPSNAFEIGTENLMTMEVHSAFAMGSYDSFDDGFGKGDLILCDRTRHIPVRVDIDEVSASMNLNENYNKFVIGPSGTGKSFTMNRILTCEYDAGALVFGIDVQHSYEGQTHLIHELSGGKDGQYHTWSKETPLTFNPFVGFIDWVDSSGLLNVDEPGVNALISLLETTWEPQGGWSTAQESILREIIRLFAIRMREKGKSDSDLPIFDDFYLFIAEEITPLFDARLAWNATRGNNLDEKKRLNGLIIDANESNLTPAKKATTLKKLNAQLDEVERALIETGLQIGTDYVGYEDLDLKNFHISISAYALNGAFSSFLNERHPADIVSSRWTIFDMDILSQLNDQIFYSLCVLQIMHAFDLKMRTMPGRKILFVDEAWKAIANKTMAPYLRSLWKTARKFSTAAIVVTQELSDITSSEVIKDTILANSPIKMLLDQSGNVNILTDESSEDGAIIRGALGLTPKDIPLLLSMNKEPNPYSPKSKEVFIKYKQGYSMVLSVEVSPQEALVDESNFERKRPFMEKAKALGSYREAIEEMTEGKQ